MESFVVNLDAEIARFQSVGIPGKAEPCALLSWRSSIEAAPLRASPTSIGAVAPRKPGRYFSDDRRYSVCSMTTGFLLGFAMRSAYFFSIRSRFILSVGVSNPFSIVH